MSTVQRYRNTYHILNYSTVPKYVPYTVRNQTNYLFKSVRFLVLASTMYIKNWDDFTKAAEELYRSNPNKVSPKVCNIIKQYDLVC